MRRVSVEEINRQVEIGLASRWSGVGFVCVCISDFIYKAEFTKKLQFTYSLNQRLVSLLSPPRPTLYFFDFSSSSPPFVLSTAPCAHIYTYSLLFSLVVGIVYLISPRERKRKERD